MTGKKCWDFCVLYFSFQIYIQNMALENLFELFNYNQDICQAIVLLSTMTCSINKCKVSSQERDLNPRLHPGVGP